MATPITICILLTRLSKDFSVKSDMSRLLSNGYLDEKKSSGKSGDSINGLAYNPEGKAKSCGNKSISLDYKPNGCDVGRPSAG